MKNNTFIKSLVIGTIALVCFQCTIYSNAHSDSENIKDERQVEKFNSIGLSISANVIVKQGSPQTLVIEGASDDVEKVITEVNGSNLKIKSRPGSWNIGKVTVYITMEKIDAFSTSGSGTIKTEGSIKCGELALAVSGSGSINISSLEANNINSAVSGSGRIYIAGPEATLASHNIAISGSGEVSAENLQTKDVNAAISGSGDCEVYVTGKLSAHISGSGKVLYKGNPVVDAKTSGSGKVRPI